MKLSFPGYYNCEKRKAIFPNASTLLGSGPMMSLTTQKHDFIFKSANKRSPILPRSNLERARGTMDKETIQKLSFSTPLNVGPPKSYKPVISYKRPEGTILYCFLFVYKKKFFNLVNFSENGK